MSKKMFLFGLVSIMAFLTSGCYWNHEVAPTSMAVQLNKGSIVAVGGPGGVYTDGGWFSDIDQVGFSTLTFPVTDPEVLTSDNQAVGVTITIQAQRRKDSDSIKNLYINWHALIDDKTLEDTISSTARAGLKNGVREFTLTKLLDDRTGLADAIKQQLDLVTEKYSTDIINVTVENIAPSADYMAILATTANIKAQTDQAQRKQELINQQALTDVLQEQQRVKVAEAKVLAEQAQTKVDVEIARRQGEITQASNQVYTDNPQAFELERLRILQTMFGQGTVYFIPQGTDLTTYFFPNGTPVTIPAAPTTK